MNQTAQFFIKVGPQITQEILQNVAKHYGMTIAETRDEVTHKEAEHLLDYVTGPCRAATSVLMQKHGFHLAITA